MSFLVVGIILLIVFMMSGVPVLAAFLMTMIFMIWQGGYDPSFLLPYGFSIVNTITLMALPLFIIAGSLMEYGGLAERLINAGNSIFGRIKGGLAILAVAASALFASLSGSAMATVSCIGSILGPRMVKQGYPGGLTAALLAASGVLGLLIPPSMLMIVYAWLSHASVLRCFLATIIPGLLVISGLIVTSLLMLKDCKTLHVVDKIATRKKLPKYDENGKRNFGVGPALMMPVIILGGIYGGFFTPTEAAAVSCIYAIPVGFFVYRGLTLATFKETLHKAGITTGVVMVCGLGTSVLGRIFLNENLHLKALDLLYTISENPTVILFIINIFIVSMGMLMSDDCVVLLTIPILAPMVTAMGIDLTHFAAIVGINIGMANITPPAAPVVYLASRVTNVPVNEMLRPLMVYIIFVYLPVLALVTLFPQVGLFLPNLILGQ